MAGNGQKFNEISARVRPYDMWVGYHNHTSEFTEVEGEVPWDTLFSNTVDDVTMQLDIGHALHGGGDPVAILKRYPGRALTVHVRDYSATNDKALVGGGDVAWDEVFELCEAIGGTQWYIVEQQPSDYPPLECVNRCLQALREMGK